jgi:small basic protein
MADMMNTLFGPLDRKYCDYFYILSIFGFVLLALLLVSSLFVGIVKRKGVDFYMQTISIALGYAIFYFQNRLLHSMCVGTMN